MFYILKLIEWINIYLEVNIFWKFLIEFRIEMELCLWLLYCLVINASIEAYLMREELKRENIHRLLVLNLWSLNYMIRFDKSHFNLMFFLRSYTFIVYCYDIVGFSTIYDFAQKLQIIIFYNYIKFSSYLSICMVVLCMYMCVCKDNNSFNQSISFL